MNTLLVMMRMGSTMRHTVMSEKTADAAYAKLTKAMADHREFSNDKAATVEIELDTGKVTYRVAELAVVTNDTNWKPTDKRFQARVKEQAEVEAYETKARRAAFRTAKVQFPSDASRTRRAA